MYAKFISLSVHTLLMCFLLDYTAAHLDEPCNLGGICLNSFLVPIKNAFCDNNICRCNDGFIQVARHKCSEPQEYGDTCEHDKVCTFSDENLICDRTRFKPACECRKGYYYEIQHKKCIPQIKKPKSTPLFPITAVILIACIGIFCGCGIICHNFRRQPELSLSVDQLRRAPRNSVANNNAATVRNTTGASNNSNALESHNHPPLLRSESRSSKYDSLLYDDPPPKYEDAVKDFPSEIVISPDINNTPQVTIIKS